MSGVNYFEKLMDGVVVEWKNLWEVTTWDKKFNAVSREKQPSVINYSYLLAVDLFKLEQKSGEVFLLSTGERKGWTTEELAGENLREGEVVAIPWGKSRPLRDVLKYYKGRFVTADNRIATSNDKERLSNKFLYYWMASQAEVIDTYYRGAGIQHPSMADVLDMRIPIPPLQIQAEIVRILDAFTEHTAEHTAELTAELTTRKKQYNYYRDQLLNFEDGKVGWRTLGSIATYSKTRISSARIDAMNYVGVDNILPNRAGKTLSNYVPTEGNLTEYQDGDVLIGNIRPYLKKIWHADRAGGTNGDVLVIQLTDQNVLSRYLYQVLADDKFFDYNMQHAKGAKMPRGDKEKIMEFLIPVPYAGEPEKSISEQARIVAILDKFDALTNSLVEGLSREIELRQKQYAYYRDLLLSFPKPNEIEA